MKRELNWVELRRVWWKILYIDAGSLIESLELLLPVNSYIYIYLPNLTPYLISIN